MTMGITINPSKPSTSGGGSGEDVQLRADFKSHKDDASHLKQSDKDTLSSIPKVNESVDTVGKNVTALTKTVDDLKLSVVDGKTKLAAAIRDKNVPTNNDASFDTMAANIRGIQSGGGSIKTHKGSANAVPGTNLISNIPFKPRIVKITHLIPGLPIELYTHLLGVSDAPNASYAFADTNTARNFILQHYIDNGGGKYTVQLHGTGSMDIPITYEIFE